MKEFFSFFLVDDNLLGALSGDRNTSACVRRSSEVRRAAALLVDSEQHLGSRAELTAVFMAVQLDCSHHQDVLWSVLGAFCCLP